MKLTCKLIGENGNVFNLIAIVRKTLKREGLRHELSEFDFDFEQLKENGGDYNDVLDLIMEYVNVE